MKKLFLTMILAVTATTFTFAQNVSDAQRYQREAEYYQRQAEYYKREADSYFNDAKRYENDASYYLRNNNYSRARDCYRNAANANMRFSVSTESLDAAASDIL